MSRLDRPATIKPFAPRGAVGRDCAEPTARLVPAPTQGRVSAVGMARDVPMACAETCPVLPAGVVSYVL